jgi:drug/metabolite transporter (DMT)-like permease
VTPPPRPGLLTTTSGTLAGDLGIREWSLLVATAGIFGSAFLWIALALRSLEPTAIGLGRVALGALALGVLPAARRSVAREDWRRLVVAGLAGQGGPAVLFALAEQQIDSAVTGMLVSGVPILTATVAALMTRRMPSRRRWLGLIVGLGGVALLAGPDLVGSTAGARGIVYVLLAICGYALASNLYVSLQQRYGSLTVVFWSLALSSVVLAPFGVVGMARSEFEWLPVLALVILGVFGTGLVRSMFVTLIGRVGATRGSVIGYLIPGIALLLGVVVLGDEVVPIQLVGVAVALTGGWIVSRSEPT